MSEGALGAPRNDATPSLAGVRTDQAEAELLARKKQPAGRVTVVFSREVRGARGSGEARGGRGPKPSAGEGRVEQDTRTWGWG